MILSVRKHKVGSNVEYFMNDEKTPTSKVLWLCVDTFKDNDVRMWVSNLGYYQVPKDADESSFLDILIMSGLTEALLTSLYEDLTFGTLVSFSKGNVHKKEHIFDQTTLKDLMN